MKLSNVSVEEKWMIVFPSLLLGILVFLFIILEFNDGIFTGILFGLTTVLVYPIGGVVMLRIIGLLRYWAYASLPEQKDEWESGGKISFVLLWPIAAILCFISYIILGIVNRIGR